MIRWTADAIWNWCRKSATLVWARLLMFVGTVGVVILPLLDSLKVIDASAWLPPKYVPYAPLILAVIGLVTEQLRKRPGSTDPV